MTDIIRRPKFPRMLRHLNSFPSFCRSRRARNEELYLSQRPPALTITPIQPPPASDELNSVALQPLAEYEEVDSHHYEDVLETEVYEVPNTGLYVNQADLSALNGGTDYSGYVPMDRRRQL